MYQLIIFSCLLAACAAQDPAPWQGPFANHINGQLVPDTPEVAAAKAQHLRAHTEIRAVLPELSEEEKFPGQTQNLGFVPQQPQQVFPQQQRTFFPQQQQNFGGQFTDVQQPKFTQFAEEIPRSSIGEVPEVAAARAAHLKAFAEVRANLPVLRSQDYTTVRSYVPQPLQPWNHNNNNLPADTPEVAAAKLEHARLFAAAGVGR